MVEFALLLPLLLTILLGMVTGGLAYYRSISMNGAVREAVRYGATLPVDSMPDWLNAVADTAVAAATGELDDGVDGRRVCVAYVHPSGAGGTDSTSRLLLAEDGSRVYSDGAGCFSDGRPDDEARVQVAVQRSSDLVLLVATSTLDLSARSTARFERQP